ncbi:hypothetical protein J2857_003594 [Neorhizobium galegae]|uniref:hypothetical protein n=1 Tax=Neorhizobium galegae TaxID=399 RepID=UPI001AE943B5|nr:hypothetical protein [Neorhizobium galegae]MBP2560825.1 hypothetical protein [Neorhizobium galegae]
MARSIQKLVGLTINVPERAKQTLDRQAAARGAASSVWAGQVFDIGFAAVCAREKSMPITDVDLDAIAGATLLLWSRGDWDSASIAKGLGVPEATVEKILAGWREYRRAG